jgi:RHS repeat-associated protein
LPEDAVFFYHGNHLSSTQLVTDANGQVQQQVFYAPFGEVISESNAYWHNGQIPDYLFNAKELDEESGMYYYSARYYAPPVFTSRDPLFEKYPTLSPYAYCGNNPVNAIDPTGKEIIFEGESKKSAFKEFKRGSRQYGISVKMDKNGVVAGNYKGKGEISKEGQQVLDAINSKSVTVNIKATNGMRTSNGHFFIGGAHMGTELTSDQSATAYQEVNPSVLKSMSNYNARKGQDMLHEVTEGYEAGLMSIAIGESSCNSIEDPVKFTNAHDAAIPQTCPIYQERYDRYGMFIHPNDWNNVSPHEIDWYVHDTKNQRYPLILQKWRR